MSVTVLVDVIDGGDGYSCHADCDPADAVPGMVSPDGDDCWVCGEPLDC